MRPVRPPGGALAVSSHLVGKLMLTVDAGQLVEELSQELDELRSFKAEFLSKSKSDLSANVSQKHRRQLEALVTHLKQVLRVTYCLHHILLSFKAIIDSRLHPLWCNLTNSTKHCSCLTSTWCCHLTNSSKHNGVLDSAHWSHGIKT